MKKDSKQGTLLNTGSMSSAREVNRLRRERLIAKHNIKRRAAFAKAAGDFVDTQFSLPDEPRDYSMGLKCPQCGSERSELCRLIPLAEKKSEVGTIIHFVYFMRCCAEYCLYRTPEFKSSAKAVHHWKLLAALTK